MRSDTDFVEQHSFVKRVFSDSEVASLHLRYFDPTLSWVSSRITKGLVESLMLRRARGTIYTAGDRETLGKDSELAATLAQGKAVIVYAPEGEEFDARAETYRAVHPLGLQIAVKTGVAHARRALRTSWSRCRRSTLGKRRISGRCPRRSSLRYRDPRGGSLRPVTRPR